MYIVTGGAGFIGSVVIKALNERGIENILVVDRLEKDEKWKNLRGVKFHEYLHADEFIQPDMLNQIFDEGVTQVYHMGACSSTTETDVDYLMKNNVEYSKILFSFCTGYDVPICYASSAATYGAGEYGYDDIEKEIYKLQPLNPYGWSKQLVDEWAIAEDKKPSKWYGVKFFNVYGPNEYHKGSMRSVVVQAHRQIIETGKVKLFKSYHTDYEDGGQLRDFVYVKDVVQAMVRLMFESHSGPNGIYNLGTGKARSFADLAKATFKALDKNENIEYIEMPDHLKGQYQYYTQASMNKLSEALPDFKFSSLEEGIKDYVQNYLEQANIYARTR